MTNRRRRRRHGRAHMAWVRSHRRRRRNPVMNRRRRRSYRRRRNWVPLTNRRRRNPRRSGGRGFFGLPPLQSVLYVGVGAVGTPVAETFINGFLPLSITSSVLGKYAVRIGTLLGLTLLAKSLLGKDRAKLVAIGGGVYVLTSAIKEFAPGIIPGLSAYVPPPGLRAYVGAGPMVTGRQMRGMGFAPSRGAAFGGSVGGQIANTGSNVIASRFRRW
jgi:hypothetical protein